MKGKSFSSVVSMAVSLILEGKKDVLREVIYKTPEAVEGRSSWLSYGDELCRDMAIPMSTDLIQKVTDVYKKCKLSKDGDGDGDGDTPLMLAVEMGLTNMVLGFIKCANQTKTNLHTGQKGDGCAEEFFWLLNEQKAQTAFDIAIKKDNLEVARLLLNNAPQWCLRSQWIQRREALLDLINHDPKFEDFIFDTLENPPYSRGVKVHGQGGSVCNYLKVNIQEYWEDK
ncbi:hypothetical protein E3N88_18732 [Mikania micrantha]|uniref:Uncharacterized protein n=1 Tax=Mikania micrantha TaxID=192012 RepID=A0A5N6NL92_9ASTR|nr:hypothetical protein E3N88_18732 [Mikania micrantha]